jgi:hypothetical protein
MTDWYNASNIAKALRASESRCGTATLITIDGPSGSGKTKLAEKLSAELNNAPVIHLDELYEGWVLALDPILIERITAWVITPLLSGLPINHLCYDWDEMRFNSWKSLPWSEFVILEGVGAGTTALRKYVSQSIWIEADEELLLDRVLERDGEIIRNEMLIWKSKEAAYFELHNIKQSAMIHLTGQPSK